MDQEDFSVTIRCTQDAESSETHELFYGGARLELPAELKLMAAILRDAIYCRDLRWINLDSDFLFSFQNCCEALGIDYRAARKALNARIKPRLTGLRTMVSHLVIRDEIIDMPGRVYTHAYGDCPEGSICSKCPECRQRYNYRYGRMQRGRRTVMARSLERLVEAS